MLYCWAAAGMLRLSWIRFDTTYALAATLTFALDLTKTIGFFVLAGWSFNRLRVAALAWRLIGYSNQ